MKSDPGLQKVGIVRNNSARNGRVLQTSADWSSVLAWRARNKTFQSQG